MIRFIQKEEINILVGLCEKHAEYEKSEYSRNGKKELLLKAIFSEKPILYCLVAIKDEKIVGFATYMFQYATWDADFYIYMDCLFLDEKSRGLGLGEKLINQIKKEGKKLDCDLIQWQTPDFNQRAIKFYKRIGAISKSKERFFLNI